MINPDVVEEREVSVLDYKPKGIPHPIIFNVTLRGKKCAYSLGLTLKEASKLEDQLRMKLNKMLKRSRKRRHG